MKFVIASGNEKKLSEMKEILAGLGVDVISQREAGFTEEIEETGSTFLENAMIKASAVCKFSGLPAIADDSGLMVDALGGAPGVFSRRYGDGGLDDEGRYLYLLSNMKDMEQRGAKFVSVIVCVFPNGESISAYGECAGEILREPLGDGGFGYDPIFLVSGTGKSMAQMSKDEKNRVSHRGAALREFNRKLQHYLAGMTE